MVKDPICGMSVDEHSSIQAIREGETYYFCSEHCKEEFLQQDKSLKSVTVPNGKTIYTCPMHPEIRQDHPGDCPKCGMHLEPLNQTGEKNEDQKDIRSLSHKFWFSLTLTVPLVLLM